MTPLQQITQDLQAGDTTSAKIAINDVLAPLMQTSTTLDQIEGMLETALNKVRLYQASIKQ